MAGLYYTGLKPSTGSDVENLVSARDEVTKTGVSRTYVAGRVKDIIAGRIYGPDSAYATKTYVNNGDSQFSTTSTYVDRDVDYYKDQDKFLTPNNAKGQPNGVASLVNGKVPLEQIPVLGVGICKGPFPVTSVYTVDGTFDIPAKIAEWKIKTTAIACQPWVFMSASVLSEGGLPVIEVRCGDPTQVTYASQTLVAQGYGRSYYYDYQTVEVFPTDPDINEGQDLAPDDFYPSTFDMVLTAWVYDDALPHQKVAVASNMIQSAAAYLARMKF